MTKTLREIYKTTDFWGILDAIEERLSEGNLQKEHLARMLALQNDWNNATRIISERHSHRLSALEQKPAETEREWIPCKGVTVRWPDGEIVTHTLACAISYEYGDKQPEPPKGDM